MNADAQPAGLDIPVLHGDQGADGQRLGNHIFQSADPAAGAQVIEIPHGKHDFSLRDQGVGTPGNFLKGKPGLRHFFDFIDEQPLKRGIHL